MAKTTSKPHVLSAMKKGTSCRACKARKVRCDEGVPCAACVRSAKHLGKECDCSNARRRELVNTYESRKPAKQRGGVLAKATTQRAALLLPTPTPSPHLSLSPDLPPLDWTSPGTASPTPSSPSLLPSQLLPGFDLSFASSFHAPYPDPSYAFPQPSHPPLSISAYPLLNSLSYATLTSFYPPPHPPISIPTPGPYETSFLLPQTVDPSQVFFDAAAKGRGEEGRMRAWVEERGKLRGV